MKKLFLILALFLCIWITSADVIPENSHYVNKCVMVENTTIDDYRLVIENDTVTTWDLYAPTENTCLEWHYHFWTARAYLVPNNTNLDELDKASLQEVDNIILLWELSVNGWWYRNGENEINSVNETYRVVNNGNQYALELVTSDSVNSISDESNDEDSQESWLTSKEYVVTFSIYWFWTVLIETIILFLLFKFLFKSERVSNLRILVLGIIASTITLPFLWFVLPLFIHSEYTYIILWETLVTAIEVVILKYGLRISWWKAIFIWIICNLCSFLFWKLAI